MISFNIPTIVCKQCGHTWIPRKPEVKVCPNPKCQSRFWNSVKVGNKGKRTDLGKKA